MCDNSLWKFNQFGLRQTTEDNLFISNAIYGKYINMENKSVVDFLKLSNEINRKFLLGRLLRYNITGNVYSIIQVYITTLRISL